jgi:hypothetical protein
MYLESSSGLMDRIVLLHVESLRKPLLEYVKVWTILTFAAEIKLNATKTKQ